MAIDGTQHYIYPGPQHYTLALIAIPWPSALYPGPQHYTLALSTTYTLALSTIPWPSALYPGTQHYIYPGPQHYTLALSTIPWPSALYPGPQHYVYPGPQYYTLALSTIPWPSASARDYAQKPRMPAGEGGFTRPLGIVRAGLTRPFIVVCLREDDDTLPDTVSPRPELTRRR